MNLHEHKEDFQNLITLTSDHLGIPEVFIEKDYWVTYVLYNLHHSDVSEKVVFKGGTSLSKAHKLIDRFSEDVDLVIMNPSPRSQRSNNSFLKTVQKKIAIPPLEAITSSTDNKEGRGYRQRVFKYNKLNEKNSDYGHARDDLLLELNFFATPSPISRLPIQTYINDFLNIDAKDAIKEFGLEPFELNILCTTRTFFEKVLSLYRNAHKSNELLIGKVRHFYDIYMLVTKDTKVKAILSDKSKLESEIKRVIEDELAHETFCDIKEFLPLHQSSFSLNIASNKEKLNKVYNDEFVSLIYRSDDLPSFDEVYSVMESLNNFIKEKNI
jgi:hypothetical protein